MNEPGEATSRITNNDNPGNRMKDKKLKGFWPGDEVLALGPLPGL